MQKNPLLKHYGQFEKIESKLKEYPIIGFDTEDDSKGTPTLFAFYGDFPKKKYVTRHWQDALDFIYSIEETTIFVAHNLEYDIANLFKADDYLMVEEMMYSSTLLRVSLYGTTHYFINSLCFFRGKLKDMAEFVGLKKYEGTAMDEKYIVRDAEIPYVFMKQFQGKLVNDIGVNLGITIGQMAMQTYRRDYMLSPVQITYNSPNCLKAYYGGRVEIFYKGNVRDVGVTDINSSYPNVMRNYYYPDTSRIEPSTIDTHEYGIGKFKVHVPDDIFLPVLPYKSEGQKLFFPTGTFTGWWTYAEVRHAIKYGARIIKEYQGEGTNSGCKPFDKFIDTFYNLRLDTEKGTFENLFYKLWLNNLYGKWCQNRAGNTMTRDKWSEFKLSKWRQNPDFKEAKIGCFHSYTVPKIEPPKTANFMWGIYVTSYARIFLHEGMMNVHRAGGTLVYCDTDSIMYTGLKKNPLPVGKKLGEWDNEKFDLGIFRQAKGYLLCNKKGNKYEIEKVASKGVPTNKAYDFIIEGMAAVQKPLRLKEALIRTHAEANKGKEEFLKEIGENVWYTVSKEMRSIYIKRSGEGVTRPVNVSEIPALEEKAIQETHTNIEPELKKDDIHIKRPEYKNLFENTVIPSGWFDGRTVTENQARLLVSQKIFYFREEQCLELTKGQVWFAGHVLQIKKRKGKRFYHIYVENFKGKKVPINFWGVFPVNYAKIFGIEENILNNYVEFIVANNYNKKDGLSLRIKTKASKYQGQFEAEVTEGEEMSEKEIKNLMALDWSKIKCPKI